jgi:hypothetical protein
MTKTAEDSVTVDSNFYQDKNKNTQANSDDAWGNKLPAFILKPYKLIIITQVKK